MRASLYYILLLLILGCKEPVKKVVDRYPNGKIMTEYLYPDKDDTTNYACKVYYENGVLKHETQIVFDMFIGEKKTFFKNGRLQRVEKLSQPTPQDASKYDCYIINFRPDGTKESEYQYVNGKINGLATDYDSTGKIARTTEYVDGKMNGKETLYYESGKIKDIAFVKNDTLRGFEIDFKENGDTLDWFHNGEYGFNGVFRKKWLDNGLILTGHHGDSMRSYVVWKWWDKANKLVKSKVAKSKEGVYPDPE
jgi:antitoxin component YwqK of YwqJK toxin-antitoxin module